MIYRGEEILCGHNIPAKGPCELYQNHGNEHLGPGERCTYISPRDGTRCGIRRSNHGMHEVTQPRPYK
jgi:hypothetical protein